LFADTAKIVSVNKSVNFIKLTQNANLKSQNFNSKLLSFKVNKLLANIFEISPHSFKSNPISFSEISVASLSNFNQYLVSLADFKAII